MTEENKTEPVAEQLGAQELPEIDVTKEHINNFDAHSIARSLIESPVIGQGFKNKDHFNYIQNLAFQTVDFAKTILMIKGTVKEKSKKLDLVFEDLKKFTIGAKTPSEEVK